MSSTADTEHLGPRDVVGWADAIREHRSSVSRGEWRSRARCAGQPDVRFYPEHRQSSAPGKEVCAGCPVLAQCGVFAFEQADRNGVWGGLAGNERKRLQTRVYTRVLDLDLDDEAAAAEAEPLASVA